MNPATRDQWTKLVAYHPTEWKDNAASPSRRSTCRLVASISDTTLLDFLRA